MKIGFVGLGNVGAKLAGSFLRNGHDLYVHDLNADFVSDFVNRGAKDGKSPAELMLTCEAVITCLPSPEACSAVVTAMLDEIKPGKIWMEMSTTDASEVSRLAAIVIAKGGAAVDCPVSGGCHRADTGNISIFAGCERETFDRVLPLLTTLGRRVLHTGPVGSASTLKVAGMDMAITYEAFKISSGTSFVHETESQVILNGSRNVTFTMDLVKKDIGLFQQIAEDHGVPLEISPLIVSIFEDGIKRYGPRAQSDEIIRRLEEPTGLDIRASGFPADLTDDELEEAGYEVIPNS